jgi:hypothetical protein
MIDVTSPADELVMRVRWVLETNQVNENKNTRNIMCASTAASWTRQEVVARSQDSNT